MAGGKDLSSTRFFLVLVLLTLAPTANAESFSSYCNPADSFYARIATCFSGSEEFAPFLKPTVGPEEPTTTLVQKPPFPSGFISVAVAQDWLWSSKNSGANDRRPRANETEVTKGPSDNIPAETGESTLYNKDTAGSPTHPPSNMEQAKAFAKARIKQYCEKATPAYCSEYQRQIYTGIEECSQISAVAVGIFGEIKPPISFPPSLVLRNFFNVQNSHSPSVVSVNDLKEIIRLAVSSEPNETSNHFVQGVFDRCLQGIGNDDN